jgi:hypothetical protein
VSISPLPGRPPLRDRPEQVFFDDPAIDRLAGVVYALAAETWVLRDKVARLEAALAAKGVLAPDALETAPEPEGIAEARKAFVAALMEPLMGRQKSNGPG